MVDVLSRLGATGRKPQGMTGEEADLVAFPLPTHFFCLE